MISALPAEYPDEAACASQHEAERWWAWRACLASPIFAVLAWGLAAKFLLLVMYLKPASSLSIEALRWKPAFALGILAFLTPWCWLANVAVSRWRSRFPWAAMFAAVVVLIACVALEQQRVTWFFVEWALIRTPNPSFARNTLMWEQRKFERIESPRPSAPLVRLVGSSQIYQGTDLMLLNELVPEVTWEKNCLAGFGPMQYPWLLDILLQPKPEMIVCWLSEFDFYREDQLPINRLRWASTQKGIRRLSQAVDWPLVDTEQRWQPLSEGRNWASAPQDQWALRGDYGDLALAAAIPLWQQRDHFRRTVFHYWQNVSQPATSPGTDGPQLAQSADMELAKESLRNNMGRKRFVEANFHAFQEFAELLHAANIKLLVCEGTTHPDATAVYDPQFRSETRLRLSELATTAHFEYLDESRLPDFDRDDFLDPYHLNEQGRRRFSHFLAPLVRTNLAVEPQSHAPLH